MKYQRAGYTESTLLFIDYFFKTYKPNKKLINHTQGEFINWLYTTSGFYDKDFSGSYFDFDTEKISKSENFNKFILDYKSALMDSDKLLLLLHRISLDEDLISEFNLSFRPKDILYWWNYKLWYKMLDHKKVLLVSSFAPLMEKQYSSGNLKKIDPDFPDLSNIIAYRTPYTFFNSGPHKNFFETLEYMKNEISKINFDLAIIACGAYAVPLAHYCHILGKTGVAIGSRMHSMWGINPKEKNPLWVNKIPKEYIPIGYEKIEKGGYWR